MIDSQIVTRLAEASTLKELYAVRAIARDHIDRGSKDFIAAIKAVRNATGMGLKEAKDWCDKYRHKFK